MKTLWEQLSTFVGRFIFGAVAVATVAALPMFLAVACYELFEAIVSAPFFDGGSIPLTIKHVLHSVELILLAPIPYLAARAIARRFENEQLQGSASKQTKVALVEVKSLIAGLIAGTMAISVTSDLIQIGFGQASAYESQSLPIESGALWLIAAKLLALIVFGLMFYGLELLVRKIE